MPQVSRFFGIVIKMYYNDHQPPHFHAEYNEFIAEIGIDTFEVLQGELPRRVMGLVLEWAAIHREELRETGTVLVFMSQSNPLPHWSRPMHRVTAIHVVSGFVVEILFSDGLRKVIDLEPYLGKGVAAPLLDEGYFREVRIESGGGIAWPNGFDFCPNYLYEHVPAREIML